MPKLPKGMFRRKGRPGWYMRLYRSGCERWVSLGADFAGACDQARALGAGFTVSPTNVGTVGSACERWLESYIKSQRSEKGQKLAAQRVRDFVVPFFGHMHTERVKREDVRSFRLWLESRTKLSATSVFHVLSDVRCLLHWCEDSGLVERSPFPRRVMPRLQERPPDRLTDEEAAELFTLPEPHGFVCRLALGTGLRWGELCRAQASEVKRFRASGSFANAVRRLSGIDGFHVHQTRHTFACQWLERGGSLAALQQVLGHASIETTQRYARLSDEAVMREAGRLCRG